MAILNVIKYGHPTLRQVAKVVNPDEIDPVFLANLVETMIEEDGVGLAATQVNVPWRIIAASNLEEVFVLVNPEIIAHSENMATDIEGCLSLPGLQAKVPRYEKLIVRALNPAGEKIEITAKGLFAVVLQHEIDHLNGILYIDRADMTTLHWIDNDPEGDLPINTPANLEQIQDLYIDIFHYDQDDENIIFEAPKTT